MNDEILNLEEQKQENLEILKKDILNGKHIEESNEINNLQDEMKKVIMDTKRNGIILNAKQSILLYQNEYDRKYKYRDDIRRKVRGVISSADINMIKKTTAYAMGEESLLSNPDYWLAPAFLALCAWYTNNKEIATKALNEALSKDAEMTSLLFCFVHLRAKRITTATKWLIKYLDMQTKEKMDDKINLVLEAMTTGIFPSSMQEICLNKINEWISSYHDSEVEKEQTNRWQEELTEVFNKKELTETYSYLIDYVKEELDIRNYSISLGKGKNIETYFNDIMDKQEEKSENYNNKIDNIINILISNHDDNEENITKEIYKNNCIIDCDGDIDKASIIFAKNSYGLGSYKNIYTHLTNICLIPNKEISTSTKKFAIALSKNIIIRAYQNIMNQFKFNKDLTINIEESNLNTLNGSNELELVKELKSHLENKYKDYVYGEKLLNMYNIITIILTILIIIFLHKYPIVVLILVLISLIYNGYTILKRYKGRKKRLEELNNIIKGNTIILLNTICEIVDITFDIKDKLESYENYIKYLSSLNYKDYFIKSMDNRERNIITGGTYE